MVTDSQGKFALKELDPSLRFRLLIVAEKYIPAYLPKYLDPEKDQTTFALKTSDLDKTDAKHILRGRVVDEDGKAVNQALVEPRSYWKGNSGRGGVLPGVDPLAVTNKNGEFQIVVAEDAAQYTVEVTAQQFAPRLVAKLDTGTMHTIPIGVGVNMTGRLIKEGKPVAGVGLGVVQKDRSVEKYLGHFEIATDADGRFIFQNLPPNETLVLFGQMPTCREFGALPVREITTGAHGTLLELKDVFLAEGLTLRGKLITVDGKPLPPETRIILSRNLAWDSQSTETNSDGSFTITGIPEEVDLRLWFRAKGFRLAQDNHSLNKLTKGELIGTVQRHMGEITILIESGEAHPFNARGFTRDDAQKMEELKRTPFQGIREQPMRP